MCRVDEFGTTYYLMLLNPLPPRDTICGNRKKIEDLFRSVLSHFKNTYPSRNLKLNNEAIFLDRESIASQCMDIHRNPRISKWIYIKAWIIED